MESNGARDELSEQCVFDCSAFNSFLGLADNIIDDLIPNEVITILYEKDHERFYADGMDFLFEVFDETCNWELEKGLLDRIEAAFMGRITHWRGWHSCRPESIDSYKAKGILPLTRDRLKADAIRVFGEKFDKGIIEEIVDDLDLQTREGVVCLFDDPISPTEITQDHYQKFGSEALILIANKLHGNSRTVMINSGEPMLLQCAVPMENVEEGFRRSLWQELVVHQLKIRVAGEGVEGWDNCAAFRTDKVVLPEYIEKFIPL